MPNSNDGLAGADLDSGRGDGSPPRAEELDGVETRLGYRFDERSWLDRALTHGSWANEAGRRGHYERLEFLGDSVLGLITAQWLFDRYPEGSEGDLASRLSYLVSAPVLSSIGRHLELGPVVRFGVGEERAGGRNRDGLLADVVEAVLGALYLDGGLEVARTFFRPHLEREAARAAEDDLLSKDPKTRLQERLQGAGRELPEYRLVAEEGPPHDRTFVFECWVEEERLGLGRGSTKKRAQQAAAERALDRL